MTAGDDRAAADEVGHCGRLLLRLRLLDLRQRQVGRHPGRFDDRLVDLREHLLHRLVIHAAAGHLGRELVLLVDLVERGRLALRLLPQLQRIGVGAVDVGLRLLLRRGDLLEGVVDRVGRVGLLDRDALDLDAGAIGIEDPLHASGDLRLDLGAACRPSRR